MSKKWLFIDNKEHVLLNTDRVRDFYIQRSNSRCYKVQCALTMPNSVLTCAEYPTLEAAENYINKIKEELESE